MFAPVAAPNRRAPSGLTEKLIAGCPFWSMLGFALRRSRPVITGTLSIR